MVFVILASGCGRIGVERVRVEDTQTSTNPSDDANNSPATDSESGLDSVSPYGGGDTDSDSVVETDTNSDSGVDAGPDSGRQRDTGSDTATGSDISTESDIATDSGTETERSTDGCLEFITEESRFFIVAPADIDIVSEDFSQDASGGAIPDTQYQVVSGDYFFHYEELTFESFAVSNQVPPGTRRPTVATQGGTGVTASLGDAYFNGYDGIAASFTSPQVIVAMSGSEVTGTEGFLMSVQRSDSPGVVRVPVPAPSDGDVIFAGVLSTCGPVIQTVELQPNPSAAGSYESQYWKLDVVIFGR